MSVGSDSRHSSMECDLNLDDHDEDDEEDDDDDERLLMPPARKKPFQKPCNNNPATPMVANATAAAASLNDSIDSATNFRFTSFPQSLPRIHHQRYHPSSSNNNNNDASHNTSLSSYETDHEEEEEEDEDDCSSTLADTPVARTRLNFNAASTTNDDAADISPTGITAGKSVLMVLDSSVLLL